MNQQLILSDTVDSGQGIPAGVNPKARSGRGAVTQPLEVALLPDALLKLPTAAAVMGVSTATLNRIIKAGELTPIKRGLRCTRLRSQDVAQWVRAQGVAQ